MQKLSELLILLILTKRSIKTAFHDPSLCIIISILSFGIGQFVFYILIKVTFWQWYLSPIWFMLIVGSAISIIILLKYLYTSGWIRIWAALTLLLTLTLGALSFGRIEYWFNEWISGKRNVWEHSYSYDPIVLYLKEKEPTGTTVATSEPGALGFKLGPAFKVIDELGLISPGVAQKIIKGDFKYPFVIWNPEYVIVSWDGKYTPHKSDWFNEEYYLIGEFDYQSFWNKNINRGVYLFKKRAQSQQNSQ